MIDYKRFYYLRNHTRMDLIDFVKVQAMRYDARVKQAVINEKEHCHIGVDYSMADAYEYNVRFRIWMRNLYELWKKHSDGLDLLDFSYIFLDQNIQREKEELENAIIRQRVK